MATQIDLSQAALDRVVLILRSQQSLRSAARELGISHKVLTRNLDRAGLSGEIKSKKSAGAPIKNHWDEKISNKYLVMKLRAQA